MKVIKSVVTYLIVAFMGISSILPTNAQSIDENNNFNVLTINAKKDRGEGTNKFNYFPEDKWKYDGREDEIFTKVDTTLSENNDVYYTVDFEGTGIEIWGYKAPRHAKVSFSLDDKDKQTVDTYAPERKFTKLVEFKDLENTKHKVKCQATGEKNPSAIAGDIQVSEARIYQPKQEAENVTFLDEEVSLYVNDSYSVRYELEPLNSKLPSDFYFTSSDETVATVDKLSGKVTAHKPGVATINGTCQSLGIYTLMKVNVIEKGKIHSTIVDSNDQYKQDEYSSLLKQNIKQEKLWTWKNDKAISEIAVLATDDNLTNVRVEIGDFKNENGTALDKNLITATQIKEATGFIGNAGYSFDNPQGIMPTGPKDQYFDILYSQNPFNIENNKFSLIWLDFKTTNDTEAGIYNGTITITADNVEEKQVINYSLEVIDASFSDADDFNFRPDYWTYPFSSAEYYDVEPFSNEHLAILKDHLLEYKAYGGTTVTGTLIEEAWGGQTYGELDQANGDIVRTPSLIKWTKKADGSWKFDYTYFDKYVELAKSIGIGDDIVLYSPMPWNDQVTYFDEKAGKMLKETISTSNKEVYSEFWTPFFQDFAKHLDSKGWFDDVSFGFDERPNMKMVFDVIDTVKNKDGKVFKKQGAYNNIYSGDGVPERMDNLSYNLNQIRKTGIDKFKQFVQDRKEKGLKTTTYTGTDIFPNTFLRSLPAEGYWTMMFSGSLNLDGFLDWAYDAWVEDPLKDITHFAFQAGDCFMVYPSEKNANKKVSLPSIRSEKYDEGVRDVNKLYLMKQNCPELADEIDSLFNTVKSNYEFDLVQNQPGWVFNGGKPARWITEKGRVEILSDVATFKKEIYEISKKYEKLTNVPVDSIQLDTDQATLTVGDSYQIHATVTPNNATDKTLIYTSQNPEIASVDANGKVHALKAGSTEIIVTNKNASVSATLKLTVSDKLIAIDSILLDTNKVNLKVGNTHQIQATISPSNATDKTLYYTSKNPEIASVDADGKVHAWKVGSTTITVTDASTKVSATLTVTVFENNSSLPNENNQNTGSTEASKPSTGDHTNLPVFSMISLASLSVLTFMTYNRFKKRRS